MRIKANKSMMIAVIFGLYVMMLNVPIVRASEMVLVQGGEFTMGDNYGDSWDFERPIHQVRISNFYIDKFEVTFDQYDAFCDSTGRNKPIDDKEGARGSNPVMHVSWVDAIVYCNWKSIQDGLKPCYYIADESTISCNFTANGYRLPTEAEWEYAARGGNLSKGYKYSGSDNADEVAWYWDNSEKRTHPVGQKKANELGLYDMSGNDWEMCWDWYGGAEYYKYCASLGVVQDPKGPLSSTQGRHVARGGGCNSFAKDITPYRRYSVEPQYNGGGIGFRLAKSVLN